VIVATQAFLYIL